MELIQTLASFFLVLVILVGIHEFGHFYVARLCGVRVLRFSIGLGTPLVTWHDKQGTEFALAPIPLGGYVKMLDESDGDVPSDQHHQAYNTKSVWQRIAILAAGPVANILLAIVVFALLALQGIASLSPHIGEVAANSPAARAGLEPGQEIVAVDSVPTSTRAAVAEQLFMRLGESGSLVLSVKYPEDSNLTYDINIPLQDWLQDENEPDPFKNLGIGFFRPAVRTAVGKVMPGSAAEKAGLQVHDQLLSIDGQAIQSWEDWVQRIQNKPGQAVKIELKRAEEDLQVTLIPSPEKVQGKTIGRIGIYPEVDAWPEQMLRTRHFNLVQALHYGMDESAKTATSVLVNIKKLIVGQISTKNLSGPIGIAKVSGDSARAGWGYYFGFLAQLSVYLAVLNLLPIPVLDGGHILYCLIEAAKGSPVSEKLKIFSAQLGIILLGGVMIVAFYNDILRL